MPNFSVHIAGYRIFKKMKVIFLGIFFQKSILGTPDNTLSKFLAYQNTGTYAEMAQKLGMTAIILINCYPHFSGKLGDRSGPY